MKKLSLFANVLNLKVSQDGEIFHASNVEENIFQATKSVFKFFKNADQILNLFKKYFKVQIRFFIRSK